MNVHSVRNEITSPLFAESFAKGCGGTVVETDIIGEWAGFGSPKNWDNLQNCIKEGHNFHYGDHAYFKRREYYKVTKNDYFHDGAGYSDLSRLKKVSHMPKNWIMGDNIIICPQSEGFFIRMGITQKDWIDSVLKKLSNSTDRKIIIHKKKERTPLAALLKNAHCVISHSSNSAVEALMNGVPAIQTARSSANSMCRNNVCDVENLYYPDNRLEWAGVLADNQYTFEELANGMYWSKHGSW